MRYFIFKAHNIFIIIDYDFKLFIIFLYLYFKHIICIKLYKVSTFYNVSFYPTIQSVHVLYNIEFVCGSNIQHDTAPVLFD